MIRTYDVEQINSVLKHPDIWPCIADGEDIDSFTPPMGNHHYLYDEGILFILHPSGEDWTIHANVLPESRSKASEAAEFALDYGFNTLKAKKIVANIPEKYGNVYGFALKFLKDKGLVDGEHQMALEVEEWVL